MKICVKGANNSSKLFDILLNMLYGSSRAGSIVKTNVPSNGVNGDAGVNGKKL